MNLYKAAILTINLFLLEYVFPSARLSNSDIWYLFVHQMTGLICSLAHEIVMSMPSLYKAGAVFLIFPGRQAAKVLGRQYKQYIVGILMKVAVEIPVAMVVANTIQASDE